MVNCNWKTFSFYSKKSRKYTVRLRKNSETSLNWFGWIYISEIPEGCWWCYMYGVEERKIHFPASIVIYIEIENHFHHYTILPSNLKEQCQEICRGGRGWSNKRRMSYVRFNFFSCLMWHCPFKLDFKFSLNIVRFYTAAALIKFWFKLTFSLPRAGNSLIGFPNESLVFCPKMSEWVIPSKKRAIHSFAHFWWATWAIRSWLPFFLSDLSESLIFGEHLSDLLTSLTKKEGFSESLIF